MATVVGKNSRGGVAKVGKNTRKSSYTNFDGNTVIPQANQQSTASGGLKDLSIGLAKEHQTKQSASGSIKDLSIGLAKGSEITQDDITRAQAGGPSLSSLSSPSIAGPATSSSRSQSASGKSNATGVAGYESRDRYSRYGLNDEPVIEEPNYEDIQKELTKNAQKEINSLYKYEKDLLEEQSGINKQNDRSTAAINTLTGLAGSSEANVQQQKTTREGQQANDRIRNAVEVQVQGVLSDIRTQAQQMYQFERTQANADAETRMKFEDSQRQRAQENIMILAQSGATKEGFAQTDPEGYAALSEQVGGEDMLKAMFTLNRPQETILDKKIEGGKYVIAFQNPLDGSIKVETVDLGLPPQYTKTVDAGDRILAIPDGWSGDPSELLTINKGLTPSQAGGGSGLPSNQQIDNERSFFTAFKGEPIVKNYNEVVNKKLSVDAIIENGVGGPADLAIVFEFMKSLDPTSVVRESEYDTAAKSGNIFSGVYAKFNGYLKPEGGFLPPEVKAQFQNLTNQKLNIAQRQYDNVANEYRGIAERQGLNPENVVVGYGNVLESAGQSTQIKDSEGNLYDASALTPEEYEEAIASGYTPA